MRIGIDARELSGRPTGAGRYLGGLLREWAADERARRHEFVLYTPARLGIDLDSHRFAARLVEGSSNTWWEQVRLPSIAKRDHLDVFFGPAYAIPLQLAVPAVVAIHDVSFMAHPEWFRMREGMRRRFLARHSARLARAIITISEFSRRELIDTLGAPEERIHVIPPGVNGSPSAAANLGLDERVLFVGTILNRRHVPDLIRSFSLVARHRSAATLDLIGDDRTYPPEDLQQTIRAENLDGRIHWHRYVSEAELSDFYRGARAFAFLSEYEGLGLTPLEALAANVPPVLLDTPVSRESCGEAALYVQRGDLAETARALEKVLADDNVRSRLLAQAPRVLARYTWPGAARKTLELLEQSG
jgi:glycosyltransferase involved in cell wall biosynthesis